MRATWRRCSSSRNALAPARVRRCNGVLGLYYLTVSAGCCSGWPGAGGDRRYPWRQEAVPGRRIGIGSIGFAESGLLGKDTFLLGALVFAIANLGFSGGNIFYEALLPDVARVDDIDRVSARGYALGYLGEGCF